LELREREKQLGYEHPDVAESATNLAILYNQKVPAMLSITGVQAEELTGFNRQQFGFWVLRSRENVVIPARLYSRTTSALHWAVFVVATRLTAALRLVLLATCLCRVFVFPVFPLFC
jgi:hypothetical protein